MLDSGLLGIFAPGPAEICIVIGVILVLFGPKQLPKIARSLGSVGVEFKKGLKDVQEVKKEVAGACDSVVGEINSVKQEVGKTIGLD